MSLKDPKDIQWKILWCVSGGLDVAQWGIDFIPLVGEIANEILDPVIGTCLAIYFQLSGVSLIKQPSRLASLVGGYLAEALSDSVAPAWVIDVWYIHRTVKQEWAVQQGLVEEQEMQERQDMQAMNRNGVRLPARLRFLNKNGRREPVRQTMPLVDTSKMRSDIRPPKSTPTVAKARGNGGEQSFAA